MSFDNSDVIFCPAEEWLSSSVLGKQNSVIQRVTVPQSYTNMGNEYSQSSPAVVTLADKWVRERNISNRE